MPLTIPSSLTSRIRLVISISGMVILLAGFGLAFTPANISVAPKLQTRVQIVDSDFSAAMVRAEDNISDLQRRLDALEKLNLKDEMVKVQESVDSMYFFIKCIAGGILTLLGKELVGALKPTPKP